jgi:3-hydroxyisobutyrate dehydrogenase-like beta-hydroxyacid dehydrogenase
MAASQSLTLIGVGNMGAALAHGFLKSSNSVTVWNRTFDRPQVKAVVDAGAVFEANIEEAISKNSTIFICLLDYLAIKAALNSLPNAALKVRP